MTRILKSAKDDNLELQYLLDQLEWIDLSEKQK